MSGVIKAGRGKIPSVRKLALTQPTAAASPRDVEIESLRAQLAAAEQRLERQARALEEQADQGRRELADAEARGRAIGIKEGLAQAAGQGARLERGIAEATAAVREQMGGLERLAMQVARESLARIVGDPAGRLDLIRDAIGHALSKLDAHAVLHVAVSAEDFPDAATLKQIANQAGRPQLRVFAEDLPPGACRIKLTLGSVEVGLDQQWSRLDALLDDWARPGGAR